MTVSEHVVKTRPGATIVVLVLVLVVYRVYTLRPPLSPSPPSSSLSPSLTSSPFLSLSLPPSLSYALPFSLFRHFSTNPLSLLRLTARQSIALPGSLVRLLFRQVRRKRLEDHTSVRLASIVPAIKTVVSIPFLSLSFHPML